MWQICGYIPQTLISLQSDITEMAAQLSTTFFLETFIHAKEKVCCFYLYTILKCYIDLLLINPCFLSNISAYYGTVGGTFNQTVQCISGSL